MTPPLTVTLACPAKLNLALTVGDPLPASAGPHAGYHPLESWMVALDFCDTLRVTLPEDRAAAATFDLAFAEDAPGAAKGRGSLAPHSISRGVDWPLTSDLTYRAHRLIEEHVGRPLPVQVQLSKRIPAGTGLGGGSADAAGMIIALDTLYALNLGADAASGLASKLGSDVAFALAAMRGQPSMIVSGLGERLEALPLVRGLDLVLVLPAFACPTAAVYRAFDALPAAARRPFVPGTVRRLAQRFLNGSADSGQLLNDLTPGACVVQPALEPLLQTLGELLGRAVHLTGSGSACFALTDSGEEARRLAAAVHETLPDTVAAFATGTPPRSAT